MGHAGGIKFQTSISDHPYRRRLCECGSGDPTSPLENCRYDGAGEALRHIYGTTREDAFMRLPSSAEPADLRVFNQTPFAVAGSGLADEGYVYVPPRCARAGGCALHIFLHGCFGCVTCADGPNTTLVTHAGFNGGARSSARDLYRAQEHQDELLVGGGLRRRRVEAAELGLLGQHGYGGADYDLRTARRSAAHRDGRPPAHR